MQDEMLAKKILRYLTLPLLVLAACEQYIGFDYEAESVEHTAKISGTVRNVFTDKRVGNALIQMGTQTTRSDNRGEYLIHYILRSDEERDKPVQVSISADNYLPFSDSFVLYPGDTEFDPRLEYAAPIIQKNALAFESEISGDPALVCQAQILDYQGVDDINTVMATFSYAKEGEPGYKKIKIDMNSVQSISAIVAYYQCIVPTTLPDGWVFYPFTDYQIFAEDHEGYSHTIYDVLSDTLLFSPIFP